MKKIKNYACKDWIVLDTIIKHSIMIFECQYKKEIALKNGDNK